MDPERRWLLWQCAPSGTAAETASEPDEKEGEIADDEVESADRGETTSEAEPEEEVAEEAPASLTDRDYFTKAGLPYYSDPSQFAAHYRQLAAQQAENQQLRQWYAFSQQQQAAQQAQQKPVERKKLWEIPQFDMSLKQGLMLDENGQVTVKPGYDPRLPQLYQEYQSKREAAMDQALQMLSDPQAFYEQHLQPTMVPFIQQQAQEIAQQHIAQMQEQQALQQFEQENREWIYDANNQLTPLANQWNQHFAQAKQFRHPNPVAYATSMIDAQLFSQHAAQAAQGAPPTEGEKKLAFLKDKNKRTPNRSGTFPNRNKKGPPQNGADPWKRLREELDTLPKEDFE